MIIFSGAYIVNNSSLNEFIIHNYLPKAPNAINTNAESTT